GRTDARGLLPADRLLRFGRRPLRHFAVAQTFPVTGVGPVGVQSRGDRLLPGLCALGGRIPSGPGGTSSDRRARPVVGDHRGGGRAVCHRPWPGDTVEPASASSAVLPRRGGGTGPIPGRGRFAAAGGDAIVLDRKSTRLNSSHVS